MLTANFKSLSIHLFGDIDNQSASFVISNIEEMNRITKNKNKRIKLYIDSRGGSVHNGFSIIDAMRTSGLAVDTYSYGQVASCGFLIFINGQMRTINKNSRFMWHDASYGLWYASTETHRENLEETDKIMEMINRNIIENTNLTQEDLTAIYKSKVDKWYNADEMLEILLKDDTTTVNEPPKGLLSKWKFW